MLVIFGMIQDPRFILFLQESKIQNFSFLPHVQNGTQTGQQVIYRSSNLSGHDIFAECNPGGGTHCACSSEDVRIASFRNYGEVVSNAREVNTYVNAIGYKKFTEKFDTGAPVGLSEYKFTGEFSITRIPSQDLNQIQNGQAIHLMIQFWDGRNALYEANAFSLEGAIYWDLNPWEVNFGKIMVYSYPPLKLVETGITLEPDTNWHSFELVIDLVEQRYSSVTIDGEKQDLQNVGLAKVFHPDWGKDISLSITTESLATWPQVDCRHIFSLTSRFKDLEFSSPK